MPGVSLDTSGAEQVYTWKEAHENRVLILLEKALAISLKRAADSAAIDPAELASETASLRDAATSLDSVVIGATQPR